MLSTLIRLDGICAKSNVPPDNSMLLFEQSKALNLVILKLPTQEGGFRSEYAKFKKENSKCLQRANMSDSSISFMLLSRCESQMTKRRVKFKIGPSSGTD